MTAPSPSGWIRATGNNPLLQRFLPHRIPETTERGNDTAARSIAAFRPFSIAWHNFGYPLQRQDVCTDATPPVPAEIPSCMHTPDRKRTASRRPKFYSIMNKSTLTAAILLSAAVSRRKRSDTPGYAGEDLSSKVTVSPRQGGENSRTDRNAARRVGTLCRRRPGDDRPFRPHPDG